MTDDSNVTSLPTGEIDFDLDGLEKEAKEIYPIFRANIGGKSVEFTNPDEVDWQDLVYLEGPVELIQFLTTREDLKHIREQSIPGWKLGKLMEAVLRHYGAEEKFARAQREAKAAQRGQLV